MLTHTTTHHRKHRAQSSQQETRLLRIESPSIATAKDYYYNQYRGELELGELDFGDKYEDTRDGPPNPKLRAIAGVTHSHPRRHSSAVQEFQSPLSSISTSVLHHDSHEVGSSCGRVEVDEIIVRGKRKISDVNTSSASSSNTESSSTCPTTLTSSPRSTPPHLPASSTSHVATRSSKIHNPLHPLFLGNIPFSYTLRKLQDWGMVYLYNSATADVFVRAVPLRLPHPVGNRDRFGQAPRTLPDSKIGSAEEINAAADRHDTEDTHMGGLEDFGDGSRGRISSKKICELIHESKSIERLSVSLERTTLEDPPLRDTPEDDMEDTIYLWQPPSRRQLEHPPSSSSKVAPNAPILPASSQPTTATRQSYSPPTSPSTPQNIKLRIRIIPAEQPIAYPNPTTPLPLPPRRPITVEKSFPINLSLLSSFSNPPTTSQASQHNYHVPALPLHIEYAIYRAPLLGAILLSEFVQKGDTVEVPVPWPEVWEETVVAIYTGAAQRDNIAGRVRANLMFLGHAREPSN